MTNEDGLRTMVTNKSQARELHMVRMRREWKKRQLTRPEPATSRYHVDYAILAVINQVIHFGHIYYS